MLLFFDIDGTLFDDSRKLPASVLPALEKAHENGHLLFINTGRTLCNLDHRLD
ncbi:MAG: HAD-IIB family hydrolase, partial [Clostridia bacterium]|nr:HAD-IIB family hydrolase [Clostridia bacterium]